MNNEKSNLTIIFKISKFLRNLLNFAIMLKDLLLYNNITIHQILYYFIIFYIKIWVILTTSLHQLKLIYNQDNWSMLLNIFFDANKLYICKLNYCYTTMTYILEIKNQALLA